MRVVLERMPSLQVYVSTCQLCQYDTMCILTLECCIPAGILHLLHYCCETRPLLSIELDLSTAIDSNVSSAKIVWTMPFSQAILNLTPRNTFSLLITCIFHPDSTTVSSIIWVVGIVQFECGVICCSDTNPDTILVLPSFEVGGHSCSCSSWW